MSVSRREFIKNISSASLFLLGGSVLNLTPSEADSLRKKSSLRFIVASDGHYGQEGTEFNLLHETLIQHVTDFHAANPLDFCVINGDIIHDEKDYLVSAKSYLDKLPVEYYVTKGNHDKVSDGYWKELWGISVNHEVKIKGNSMLLATTSNEAGEYLSPDLEWMKMKLDANKKAKNIFIFIHIPQAKWTKNAIDTPAFFELLRTYKNIRGVFHGHEHDQDGVRMVDGLPFMFDSHIGGNWGTSYKGFRVVELIKDNSILTYLMNPTERINQASF
ncbi:MAG: metallophosphoesterase [Cyclobacteriaceae bacterium]|nr:metallophosphoesterase [Cyclobacteriaceae bacterium]MDH4296736.1 metallophosphoesterase [Cyclobacteriaceae bacterium]MDH5247815.1 metallophosphoesterase [Cyclobacteriaceae bacterium]